MAKKQEKTEEREAASKQAAPKAEQVGFHKGALTTLAKERQEMAKILAIVEQLMHMHIEELKKLGVDLEKEAEDFQKQQKQPIEDILRK